MTHSWQKVGSDKSISKGGRHDNVLGFFPKPGPDELLYSVVARYGSIMPRTSRSTLIKEFFGTSVGIAAVDLPRRIGDLAARLPCRRAGDVEDLIRENTLFPYMLRFAPSGVADAARRSMEGGAGRMGVKLGIMANTFAAREWLTFCPACARSDADFSGLSKWRRVHQLPGVFVCPLHGLRLLKSEVHRIRRRGKAAFSPLTVEMVAGAPFQLPCRVAGTVLRAYAAHAQTLLQWRSHTPEPEVVQGRLRTMLSHYRWPKAPSLLRSTDMARDFLRHSRVAPMLAATGIEWSSAQAATALNRILYAGKATKHPLLVSMVLEFAGASVEDLLGNVAADVEVRVAPTPSPPAPVVDTAPCGNPRCERWAGPVRGSASVGKPSKVRCDLCGFVYALDGRRPGGVAVLETGALWDRKLVEMLAVPELSLRQISAALGVAPTTAMRHARRLGAWRREWRERPKVMRLADGRAGRLLEKHRAAWLQSGCPLGKVPVKQMERPAFNAYRYLIRYDRDWMDAANARIG